MLQHDRPPTLMPLGEQDAAASALVLHVLEAGDEVRYATEAGEHARQRGPETVRHTQRFTRQRFFLVFLLPFRFCFFFGFGYTRFKLARCRVCVSGLGFGGGNCKTKPKKAKWEKRTGLCYPSAFP